MAEAYYDKAEELKRKRTDEAVEAVEAANISKIEAELKSVVSEKPKKVKKTRLSEEARCAKVEASFKTVIDHDPIYMNSKYYKIMKIKTDFTNAGFKILAITKVMNTKRQLMRSTYDSIYGKYNHSMLYHMSKGPLEKICEEGLDIRASKGGYFGYGIYTTDNVRKANNYSANKGNPDAARFMFVCDVNLGKVYEYETFKINTTHRIPPSGYNSVKGNIDEVSDEYVVYDNNQIDISYVVTYTVPTGYEKVQTYRFSHTIYNYFSEILRVISFLNPTDFKPVRKIQILYESVSKNSISPEDFTIEIKKVIGVNFDTLKSKMSVEDLYVEGLKCNPPMFVRRQDGAAAADDDADLPPLPVAIGASGFAATLMQPPPLCPINAVPELSSSPPPLIHIPSLSQSPIPFQAQSAEAEEEEAEAAAATLSGIWKSARPKPPPLTRH